MSDLQKLGTLVALLVGLVTLGTGIWSASSNFTKINSKLDYLVQTSEKTTRVLEEHQNRIAMTESDVEALKTGALLYVYEDKTYLVVQTPKGKQLEIPIFIRTQ